MAVREGAVRLRFSRQEGGDQEATRVRIVEWKDEDGAHCYRFSNAVALAVEAALAARRPLLVRGLPGTGKSHLARAVAASLRWPFVSETIDSRTEARDLQWRYDSVARLAKAQSMVGQPPSGADGDPLREDRFLKPGVLWWAFDWDGAGDRAGKRAVPTGWRVGDPRQGVVVLIDEIDKADADVPNGLLEALGDHSFLPQGLREPVVPKGRAPLVILTTNEERSLPDAFVRRCVVLTLEFPDRVELGRRAAEHFPGAEPLLINEAIDALLQDRERAKLRELPLPGQAELLDLLRAITELETDPEARLGLLQEVRRFFYDKHPDA